MFKLVLEKAEEPEIKLPTSTGSSKKAKEFQKNIYFCFIDYAKAFDCVDHNKLWKILQEIRIPDHLTCLMRNLYAGQEATVRTGQGTTGLFQIGKGVRQGCILSPCFFNLHAEYIIRNAGLDEAQAEIRIARRNINNLRYAYDTTLMAESEKDQRASWWKWSSPITSWQIDGETVQTVQFSRSVVSDSLRPHEPQHARPPCPSPTPRVHPNPCPSSWWWHPTISASVIPFSSCLQSFPASQFFPVSQSFKSGGQKIGVSASASVLPVKTQDWSPLAWTGWISLQSKGLSRVFSNITVQKHQFFCT